MINPFRKILYGAFLVVVAVGGYYGYKLSVKRDVVPLPSAQIAFVNLSRVNTEAQAVRHFKELIERQYKSFHEEILDREKQLQKQYEEIRDIEKKSPEKAKTLSAKKDDLDRQVTDLDKTLRARKDTLNKSFARIQEQIEGQIREIVTDVAKRRNLNLVFNATILDASVVLYGGSELDITDEVLRELNLKLPTVHLPSE